MGDLIQRAVLCIAMALTFVGWGELLDDLMQRSVPRRIPVAPGALGLAVVLAIGGILNTLHLLVSGAYGFLFLVGAGYMVFGFIRRLRQRPSSRVWVGVAAIVTVVALPSLLQSLHPAYLNYFDDRPAYAVMPVRMVQLGTLQPDPFNYREAVSGPGGMAFLQAPAVALFGVSALRLVDHGSALFLLIGAAILLFRRFAIPPVAGTVLLASFLALPGHEDLAVNASSYLTTLVLLLGLIGLLSEREDDSWVRPVYAALLLAGIVALKNVAVPMAAALCAAAMAHGWWRQTPRIWLHTVVAGGVLLGIVGAWYLPRILAPVHLVSLSFGNGPDEVNFGAMFREITRGNIWDRAYLIVFLVLACAAPVAVRRQPYRGLVWLVSLAIVVGVLAMIAGSGGIRITRYGQPLCLVGYLYFGTILVGQCSRRLNAILLSGLIAVGFVAFRRWGPPFPIGYFADYRATLQSATQGGTMPSPERGWKAAYPTPAQIRSSQNVQAAMPPGAVALVHTNLPFLFDFHRNQLRVVDLPAASPTADIPWHGQGPELVNYLRACSITYIVYDYGDEAGLSTAGTNSRLNDPNYPRWERKMIRQLVPFHAQLRLIAMHWPRTYDDGQTVVINISAAATASQAALPTP